MTFANAVRCIFGLALTLPVTTAVDMRMPLPPGVKGAVYDHVLENSDFELNLQPPTESAADVRQGIDAVMQAEDAKLRSVLLEFERQKKHVVEVAKLRVRDAVDEAFALRSA